MRAGGEGVFSSGGSRVKGSTTAGPVNRDAIATRQGGYCWWCERPLGQDFAIHHRKLRKHGGSNGPENLLALHHGCHNMGTGAVHLAPKAAYTRGFLVHSWADPSTIPLAVGSGLVTINNDGTATSQGETHEW